MVKYLGKIVLSVLIVLGFFTNSFITDSKAKTLKGIYYDNFEYSENVSFNKAKGTDIDYNAELTAVGDSYEIIFDVVNDTKVDMLVNDYYIPENNDYIKYELTYLDGKKIESGDILEKGTTKRIKYKVSYVNLITEDDYTVDSSFTINYTQSI